MKLFLYLILALSATAPSYAQTDGKDSISTPTQYATELASNKLVNMGVTDYVNLKLPPLHVLMENARRSPQVEMYESSKNFEESELKTIRREWMKYIHLNANYSYGSTDINSQLYYNTQYPVIQNVSGTEQSWWTAGASISLPLDQIFNRRNKIKQQQKKVESIKFEVDKWHDEVCLKIIDSYTAALQNLALLESSSQTMIIAKAQYQSTELDFMNGKADTQTLSRQQNIADTAIREYQKIRMELTKALLQLEVLSKTKIISQ